MEGQVRLRMLGPVEMQGRDGGLRPSAPQLRLLLALLALSSGQVVPVVDLIDALWDERPPPSARASLQILVTKLRKPLAAVPGCCLERYGDGYQMQISPRLVDVYRFRALVTSARQVRDDDEAIAELGQALSLWRGPALADVAATARVEAIRAGLAEEHLSAVQDRFGRLLAVGRDVEAAAEISVMLARHPLAERLAGMLMTAWYRGGRQADALQVFRDLRGRLVGELGVEPCAELQRLHQQILSRDPALEQVESQNGHAAPMLVALRQLPAAPTSFIGRQRELRSLTGRLGAGVGASGPVIMVISGTPGVGKTALALHWAHQVQRRFPDGQLYVNLRGFDPSPAPVMPAEAIAGFLDSLGVTAGQVPPRLEAQAGLYRSLLADKRMLIVLDNARDEAQVRPLLPGSPTCVVLVTSRNEFTGLVAAQGACPVRLDVLTEPEARQLLASRLGAERVAEAAAVTEVISLCAQLPLALAIAAAQAATRPALTLTSLAAGLRGIRDRLDGLDAGDEAANIKAVFSWSYRRLSERAARVFRVLGVHPGPDISVAAAACLAAVSAPSARTALSELTRANLVQEHTAGRFSLHDLLRAYAADLGGDNERRSAAARMLDYYLYTARAAIGMVYPALGRIAIRPPGPGTAAERFTRSGPASAWLQAEHQVLLAVLAAAADSGFDAHAWQLPAVLREHFAHRGHYLDWAQAQRIALAAGARLGDDAAQACAHRDLGDALIQLRSWEDARRHLQDALRLYGTLGDRVGQAGCHCSMARICESLGDHAQSLHHAKRALRLFRAVGDLAGQACALNGVGWDYALLGDNQRALSYCTKALELHRVTGNRFGEATTLDSLGYCHHQAGRLRQALAFYQQALGAYADVGDRYFRAHTLIHLGETYQASGDRPGAREAWRQALEILDDLHHHDAEAVRARLQDVTVTASGRSPVAAW